MTITDNEPTLTVHSVGTPNGRRVTVLLEILGTHYNYHRIDITKGENLEKSFLKINPYGKIPAITDIDPNTNKEIHVFESGAILEFLVHKYDTDKKVHYEFSDDLYWEQTKWLFWTTSSLSPNQGNLSFYRNFASEHDVFAIEKSEQETKRLYKVLDSRLDVNNGWIVGDHLNIADISAYTFVKRHEFVKLEIQKSFPFVYKWLLKLNQIEGAERGYNYDSLG